MDYTVAYSPYKPDGWAIRTLWEESAWTILLPTHPTNLTGGLLGHCGRSLHGLYCCLHNNKRHTHRQTHRPSTVTLAAHAR